MPRFIATLLAIPLLLAALPAPAPAQEPRAPGAHQAEAPRRAWLVTPKEAAARKAPRGHGLSARPRDADGPRVLVRSPGAVKELKAPVNINVLFEPRDQAEVDMASLKVTYVALFNIDITDRLTPYLVQNGIVAQDAALPPGQHTIEIAIRDRLGRRTVEQLDFAVLE